jgi:hypothetical protein
MSASNAPTYYFSGIQFNSAFYTTSTSPLTQTQASALYLLKNTADTATALETFTDGILTNNITPTSTSSTISLNSSKTGSTNADPAIAIATSDLTRTIKIGNESSTNQNSVHIANLDITYQGINNITGTTGIVQIGNKQTTGILNLGCSTAGNVRTSAPINIGTDITYSGLITVGSTLTSGSSLIRNADIIVGNGKSITLAPATSYVLPTTGQLGYKSYTLAGGTIASAVGYVNLASFTLPQGVYILTGQSFQTTATPFTAWLGFSATSATQTDKYVGQTVSSGSTGWLQINVVYEQLNSGIVYLMAYSASAGYSFINNAYSYTRIG